MKKQLEEEYLGEAMSDILNRAPEENLLFVDYSMALASRIATILEAKNMKQKDLARLLNKTEPEISKWLSGTHNFTLRSLAKIEAVLGESLLSRVSPNLLQTQPR